MQERLAQSLHNAVWLTLGIERQDYRVQRPWSATIVQKSQSAVPLAPGTRIIEVFERPELANQLLILGEPGAGKTTMMLELAEDLLKRARADNTKPIPVLLNLSSWKDPQQSIFNWLVGELKSKYGIGQNLAQQWLKDNQLLPLLDGLDEVAPQHQKACAVALNAWLTGELMQRPCGVLICCRREEFEQVVQQPLSLYGAIYLQALTIEQIEDYFTQFGLQDVWETVQQDEELQDKAWQEYLPILKILRMDSTIEQLNQQNESLQKLLTKPLFLSMFGLVQTQGKFSFDDWRSRITSKQKIEYLLDTYWAAAIERELIIDPIARQQGILSKTYGKKPPPTRKAVRRSLVFAAKMLERESNTDLLIEKMQPTALITQQQKRAYKLSLKLIEWLIVGLIVELIMGLTGLFLGLTGLTGLFLGLIEKQTGELREIYPVAEISISMSHLAQRQTWRELREGLIVGLIMGLFVGLFVGSIGGLTWLFLGLILGLISGLLFGLMGWIRGRGDIQTHIKPNQGIKNSVKNMLTITMIALVIALPFKMLLENLLTSVIPPQNIPIPLIIATSLWCSVFLSFMAGGGDVLLQHLVLRLILAWNRYAPLRYDLLLNYCTERLILQRVGGRYRFMHKLLQDHFAKMDLE